MKRNVCWSLLLVGVVACGDNGSHSHLPNANASNAKVDAAPGQIVEFGSPVPGSMETVEYAIAPFTKIRADLPSEITLRPGKRPQATVTAEATILDAIALEVHNGTLLIAAQAPIVTLHPIQIELVFADDIDAITTAAQAKLEGHGDYTGDCITLNALDQSAIALSSWTFAIAPDIAAQDQATIIAPVTQSVSTVTATGQATIHLPHTPTITNAKGTDQATLDLTAVEFISHMTATDQAEIALGQADVKSVQIADQASVDWERWDD